jgi:alpha-N-acetylglucosaminidase
MRIKLLLTTLIPILLLFQAKAQDSTVIAQLISRIVPGHADTFESKIITSPRGKSFFQIYSHDGKIMLAGNSNNEIAVAFNWYLKYYCNASVSSCGNQLTLPEHLPLPKDTLTIESPFQYRFYLNYCTFSYSMAFWDWKRWERELDWMAMNGINLSMALNGVESVWQNTLKRFGYSDPEITSFLCGPAFEAWWLMGNLESWGGPVSQNWIDGQAEMQKKILSRMNELDIKPVVQGFYGMVPNSLIKKFPTAKIHDTGKWCSYLRPGFLLPTDPLFAKMASVYYEELEKLYGKQNYFAGDPFHEGGIAEGVDVTQAGSVIQQQMQKANPGSTWVLTAWQNNPREALLKGIDAKHTLVVDLWAECRPQWGGKESEWKREKGFLNKPWIWSIIPSFGANEGLYGKLNSYANDIPEALASNKKGALCGIGAAPEGMGTIPVVYDLLYEMAWRKNIPNVEKWLVDYQTRRYGERDANAAEAWRILGKTVYNCNTPQEGCSESILCSRPGLNPITASTWGTSKLYYDPAALAKALDLLLKSSKKFTVSDAYNYDVTDIMRQVLANYAQVKIQKVRQAFEQKDLAKFRVESNEFLDLMRDQDQLLATRKEFMLGTWIEYARNKGSDKEERKLYEWNARTQITVWGNREGSETGGLHDYANKEWSGLISDFYLPRWELYFKELSRQIIGTPEKKIDFYAWEEQWTHQQNNFPTKPKGNSIEVATLLFQKYKQLVIR